jgi:hypothetical protein
MVKLVLDAGEEVLPWRVVRTEVGPLQVARMRRSLVCPSAKVYALEKKGGSIIGGVFKLLQEKKSNPPPPR